MADSQDTAQRDENRVVILIGVSSQDTTINGVVFTKDVTPVPVAVDPTTGEISFTSP